MNRVGYDQPDNVLVGEIVKVSHHNKNALCCCCRRRKLELMRLIDRVKVNSKNILYMVKCNPGKFHEDTITQLITKRENELKIYMDELDIINDCYTP